jgi:hypothetical protein
VLTALGERVATIAATEQRASAALQAMITDGCLTVSRRCTGAPERSATVRRLRVGATHGSECARKCATDPRLLVRTVLLIIEQESRRSSFGDDWPRPITTFKEELFR